MFFERCCLLAGFSALCSLCFFLFHSLVSVSACCFAADSQSINLCICLRSVCSKLLSTISPLHSIRSLVSPVCYHVAARAHSRWIQRTDGQPVDTCSHFCSPPSTATTVSLLPATSPATAASDSNLPPVRCQIMHPAQCLVCLVLQRPIGGLYDPHNTPGCDSSRAATDRAASSLDAGHTDTSPTALCPHLQQRPHLALHVCSHRLRWSSGWKAG